MNQLEQAIANDNLIIFVGSGLSKSFGLPDWNKMVINIIKELNKPNLSLYVPILEDGSTLKAIDVLDFLKREEKSVRDYIRDNFNLKADENFNLHKKLLKLSDKIITTNYDNAFEIASAGKIIPSKPSSKYAINEINKKNEPFILKLHGSFEEPDNCIVFKSDYEGLYVENNNQAAPEKLKSLFSNSTFLFVGFSFNDPEINFIFDRMNKVFGGYNKHYIITPEFENFRKYSFLEQVEITGYSQLEDKIDDLLREKSLIKKTGLEVIETEKTNDIPNSNKRIAILYPQPLDLDFASDLKNAIRPFEEIDAQLFIGSLNIKTLQQVEEFDLLIILSKIFKDKIYIEDDNLKSNLLTPKEICENIPNENIPILFITNECIEINSLNYSVINIGSYKNNIIKKFIYKATKEKKYFFDDVDIKSNRNLWTDLKLEKGVCKRVSFYGNDRDLTIGKKCLTSVIGRFEEQSSITSRLISISSTNRILNIKASGGLGKTTLIKKIAYELYNRGYYKKGVNFRNCENVKDYEDFEDLLITGFNLNDILNFKEYLLENYSNDKLDLLIILDNFETIANNLSKEGYDKAIELLKFSSDYGNIVITSREKISNEDFEDVYTLSQMITDDAVALFLNFYQNKKLSDDELKILREEILEDLLANNPLAIKLVTTSRSSISITDLRNQIKEHFFESINEEYSDVFSNNADLNIERSKSIYQSINYSYTSLNARQKLAFELLSLFPDGIGLINFKKCFEKKQTTNNISDTELRQLENKSLVENYNGVLQLQPIIRRFADYQFNKHKENKNKYCIDAYGYNEFLLKLVITVKKKNNFTYALNLFVNVKNNLIKVLDYIPFIKNGDKKLDIDKFRLLNYIDNLETFLTNENNINEFLSKIEILIPFFSDVPDGDKMINVLKLRTIYYTKEFDFSYKRLSELFPVEKIKLRDYTTENKVEKRWKNIICYIHSMEGYTLNYISCLIKNDDFNRDLFSDYHYLGIENINVLKSIDPFYYFENSNRNNLLEIDKLEKHIDSLYMEEHLQIMQCTYTLSKVKKLSNKTIKKMVVTNPYTKGLKELMFAFNSESREEKAMHFENALKNLLHIKYYYLEALYYYCSFLKDVGDSSFQEMLNKGLLLTKEFKYQYLEYLFRNITIPHKEKYNFNYEYYDLEGLKEYVEKNIESWKKYQLSK